MGDQPLTWEAFLAEFRSQYFPIDVEERKIEEFFDLKQGNLNVREYELRFTKLSKYVPTVVADERERCRRFEHGLCPVLRARIVPLGLRRYGELVSRSAAVERNIEMDQQSQNRFNKGKRTANFGQSRKAPPTQKPRIEGPRVPTKPGACFNCGEVGHYRAQCPKAGSGSGGPTGEQNYNNNRNNNNNNNNRRGKQLMKKGKMFALEAEEEKEEDLEETDDVLAGN